MVSWLSLLQELYQNQTCHYHHIIPIHHMESPSPNPLNKIPQNPSNGHSASQNLSCGDRWRDFKLCSCTPCIFPRFEGLKASPAHQKCRKK